VKPVALEFSVDLFRGNRREKDLESISLNVIEQPHANRKLFFRGFVVLGVSVKPLIFAISGFLAFASWPWSGSRVLSNLGGPWTGPISIKR
jgi:hypothetical protein